MNTERKEVIRVIGRHCDHTFIVVNNEPIRVAHPITPDIDPGTGKEIKRDCPMEKKAEKRAVEKPVTIPNRGNIWILEGVLNDRYFKVVWLSQKGAMADQKRRLAPRRYKDRTSPTGYRTEYQLGWTAIHRERQNAKV